MKVILSALLVGTIGIGISYFGVSFLKWNKISDDFEKDGK